jgi:hypothetical protein
LLGKHFDSVQVFADDGRYTVIRAH